MLFILTRKKYFIPFWVHIEKLDHADLIAVLTVYLGPVKRETNSNVRALGFHTCHVHLFRLYKPITVETTRFWRATHSQRLTDDINEHRNTSIV